MTDPVQDLIRDAEMSRLEHDLRSMWQFYDEVWAIIFKELPPEQAVLFRVPLISVVARMQVLQGDWSARLARMEDDWRRLRLATAADRVLRN